MKYWILYNSMSLIYEWYSQKMEKYRNKKIKYISHILIYLKLLFLIKECIIKSQALFKTITFGYYKITLLSNA